ncbi:hypothetical protein SNEBB_006470 [Seison nebaliae]|nr:hypothetical protein SNEBB_006470 [Seison nebaliae]
MESSSDLIFVAVQNEDGGRKESNMTTSPLTVNTGKSTMNQRLMKKDMLSLMRNGGCHSSDSGLSSVSTPTSPHRIETDENTIISSIPYHHGSSGSSVNNENRYQTMLKTSSLTSGLQSMYGNINRHGEDWAQVPAPPRKRLKLDKLTDEEKMMRRKMKNRIAAQSARDRKKAKMDTMETEIIYLHSQVNKLETENFHYRETLTSLELENKELRKELTGLRNGSTESSLQSMTQRPAVSLPLQKEHQLQQVLNQLVPPELREPRNVSMSFQSTRHVLFSLILQCLQAILRFNIDIHLPFDEKEQNLLSQIRRLALTIYRRRDERPPRPQRQRTRTTKQTNVERSESPTEINQKKPSENNPSVDTNLDILPLFKPNFQLFSRGKSLMPHLPEKMRKLWTRTFNLSPNSDGNNIKRRRMANRRLPPRLAQFYPNRSSYEREREILSVCSTIPALISQISRGQNPTSSPNIRRSSRRSILSIRRNRKQYEIESKRFQPIKRMVIRMLRRMYQWNNSQRQRLLSRQLNMEELPLLRQIQLLDQDITSKASDDPNLENRVLPNLVESLWDISEKMRTLPPKEVFEMESIPDLNLMGRSPGNPILLSPSPPPMANSTISLKSFRLTKMKTTTCSEEKTELQKKKIHSIDNLVSSASLHANLTNMSKNDFFSTNDIDHTSNDFISEQYTNDLFDVTFTNDDAEKNEENYDNSNLLFPSLSRNSLLNDEWLCNSNPPFTNYPYSVTEDSFFDAPIFVNQ